MWRKTKEVHVAGVRENIAEDKFIKFMENKSIC